MELSAGILQCLMIFVVFPAIVALIIIGSVQLWCGFRASRRKTQGAGWQTCSIDTDCPPGYVCRNGVCVPANS